MLERTKNKVVALLAAGIVAAALWPAFAAGQQTAQEKPQPPQERPRMGRAAQELNITAEQQKKLQDLRQAWREQGRGFREQMMKMREDMRGLMADPQANQAKIDGLYDQMAKMRADREKGTLRFRLDREKVFTPDQLAKIKAFRGRFAGRGGLGAFGGPGMRGAWMGGRGMGRFMMMGRGRSFGEGRFFGPGARHWRMFRHRRDGGDWF